MSAARNDPAERGPADFELREIDGGRACALSLRVQPGAKRTRVVGAWNGKLKVAVAARADQGRANDELVASLASWCGLRRAQVAIERGERSRDKVAVLAAPVAAVRAALLAAPGWGTTRP